MIYMSTAALYEVRLYYSLPNDKTLFSTKLKASADKLMAAQMIFPFYATVEKNYEKRRKYW